MKKNKKLVIFGDSAFAEVAYEYFMTDSDFEVVGFTVTQEFLTKKTLFDLPIVSFEEVEKYFSPKDHHMFVALVYNQMNRIRTKFVNQAKEKNYSLASYISTQAQVWRNVQFGEHNFVFENNVIQPFVKIGSNNVFWSGNHIGHHSTIGNDNFFSSHVVVSGFSNIGNSSFFGVNSTFGNNLTIGDDCLIGAGSLIVKNIPRGSLVKGSPSPIDPISTYKKFNIEEGK